MGIRFKQAVLGLSAILLSALTIGVPPPADAQTQTVRSGPQTPAAQLQLNPKPMVSDNVKKLIEELGIQSQPQLRLRVAALEVTPVVPAVNSPAEVTLVIENQGPEVIPEVEYRIDLPTYTSRTGTVGPIAGNSTKSVTISIRTGTSVGTQGVFVMVDPQNRLREQEEHRRDNNLERRFAVVTGTATQWRSWAVESADRVPAMLREQKSHTYIQEGKITGPSLTIKGLRFAGPGASSHQAFLQGKGVPEALVQPLLGSVHSQLQAWGNNFVGKHPGAFPAFAAFPGASTPELLSVPVPLLTVGASRSGNSELRASSIEAAVRRALGSRMDEPGAADAVRLFSNSAATSVAYFLATSVLQASGSGPVPIYAPPPVPVGPVVGGSTNPSWPCLL